MKATCPNCHAEIEFRFDDSLVRVCEHCNFAVARTDRGVETLGKFADLVPIDSPLRMFAEGHDRNASFLLVGMAQLQHAAGGLWQEWYCKLGAGGGPDPAGSAAEGQRGAIDPQWGWLSEAQGRYYMTYEVSDVAAPPFMSLGPGATVPIAHAGTSRDYTVAELGSASYAAARGEIPYRLVPGAQFRFVDLEAADGSFLTIDYGDPADPEAQPSVYAGRQMTLADLQLSGGEPGPEGPADQKVGVKKLACPSCGGSIELKAQGQTQRVACPYCGTLLGVETGIPEVLTGKQKLPKPDLALGAKCTFSEGEMQIIGFVRRSAHLDGTWYPFDEYLLYAPKVGFRWLVQSDGHWSYVQPVAAGAVEPAAAGWKYDGVKFRTFQTSELRVDAVLGEMYWRVTAGETTRSEDSIAPPAMLSVERSKNEENWSLATYVSHDEVRAAFGKADLGLPDAIGVAPNQPGRSKLAGQVLSAGFVALIVLGIVFAVRADHAKRWEGDIAIGSAAPAAPAEAPVGPAGGSGSAEVVPNAFFSPTFPLSGGQNIEIDFAAALSNDWAYVAVDLVEDKTGAVRSVDADLEYYSGVEDGEAWSEGTRSASEMIGPVPAGDYILRVETQHGGASPATVRVSVYQNVFRGLYLLIAVLLLLIPSVFVGLAESRFETQRWDNSTVDDDAKPKNHGGLAFIGARLVWVAIAGLISALSSLRSDDD